MGNQPTSTWMPTRVNDMPISLVQTFRALQNWLARPKFLNGIIVGKNTELAADERLIDTVWYDSVTGGGGGSPTDLLPVAKITATTPHGHPGLYGPASTVPSDGGWIDFNFNSSQSAIRESAKAGHTYASRSAYDDGSLRDSQLDLWTETDDGTIWTELFQQATMPVDGSTATGKIILDNSAGASITAHTELDSAEVDVAFDGQYSTFTSAVVGSASHQTTHVGSDAYTDLETYEGTSVASGTGPVAWLFIYNSSGTGNPLSVEMAAEGERSWMGMKEAGAQAVFWAENATVAGPKVGFFDKAPAPASQAAYNAAPSAADTRDLFIRFGLMAPS